MKIYLKRLLTMLVVVFMLFASAVPTTVFADAADNSNSTEETSLSGYSECC